jgi:hypothetical protein
MHFDFLICSERSGSNLITKLLDSHPEVSAPFPRHAINCFIENIYKYGDLNQDANWEILVHDFDAFMNSGFSVWKSTVTASDVLKSVSKRSFTEIFKFYYECEAIANKKKRIFVKENHAHRYLPLTLSCFTDPKYILMVRDPRDMALCWKENTVYGGVKAASKYWLEDQRENRKIFSILNETGRILLIKFEELITDTVNQLKYVCDFLGLVYSSEMLEFHKRKTVRANAQLAITGGWDDLAKPIIGDNSGNYRSGLSQAEIQYIESLCREEMEYFGYLPDYPYEPDIASLEAQLPDESRIVPEADIAARRNLRIKFHQAIERIESRKLY